MIVRGLYFVCIVNDNMFPLMGQVLMDMYLAPEYVHLPRAQFIIAPRVETTSVVTDVPHVQLLQSLLPQQFSLQGFFSSLWEPAVNQSTAISTICARRVIYGVGSRLMYHHLLPRMRREVADLIHYYAKAFYCQQTRRLFAHNPSLLLDDKFNSICMNQKHAETGQKKVVIYSRGTTGTARSIANEQLLVSSLKSVENGAKYKVIHVMEYNTLTENSKFKSINNSTNNEDIKKFLLLEQLEVILNADIVIGLHGAGLANIIFAPRNTLLIELKHSYGHSLDLFLVMADSRYGQYGQVDLKATPDAVIDEKLTMNQGIVNRILDIIAASNHASNSTASSLNTKNPSNRHFQQMGKYLDLLMKDDDESHVEQGNRLEDLFGPSVESNLPERCQATKFAEFWKIMKTNIKELKYCQGCMLPKMPKK